MAKQIWKGGALLAPLPAVLVTSGTMDEANIATVAWTGIVNTVPPKTYISLRKSRYSFDLIQQSGEFAINLTSADMVRAVDYCGIYTGRKVDKFKKCNLTKVPASQISAPLLGESPLSLECRVTEQKELGTHVLLLADIVATDVEDTLLDKNGKLDLARAHLAAFAHGEYFELGRRIGRFGFSAAGKKSSHTVGQGSAPAVRGGTARTKNLKKTGGKK